MISFFSILVKWTKFFNQSLRASIVWLISYKQTAKIEYLKYTIQENYTTNILSEEIHIKAIADELLPSTTSILPVFLVSYFKEK